MKTVELAGVPVWSLWSGLLVAWIVCGRSMAAGGPDLLVATGTTAVDGSGRPHAYLAWDSTMPGRLRGKGFSVHGKPGPPGGTEEFVRLGQVPPARTVSGLAEVLGEAGQLGMGEGQLGALLDALGTPGAGSLAERLVEVSRRADTNEVLAASLAAVARVQPALALTLGSAWSAPVAAGVWTFELRELDLATGAGGAVVARITLDTSVVEPIPAPGAPIQVVERGLSGGAPVRLRWAASPALRRRLMGVRGYDVWRAPVAEAESRGWFRQAPSATDLARWATRANTAPILIGRELDELAVRDPALEISHFTDDGDFSDGSEWAYVVVARDLLGRAGMPSPAGRARACLTRAPRPPGALTVDSVLDVASGAPFVRLAWDGERAGDPLGATHYEIHRGSDIRDHRPGAEPDPKTLIETVEAATGPVAFEDRSLVPEAAHAGRTYWYAVRPVRAGPCGPIRGPISPPVLGGIRVLAGLPAPGGGVEGSCGLPTVVWRPSQLVVDPVPPGEGKVRYRIECRRMGPGIVWTEVKLVLRGGLRVVEFGRTWYPAEEDVLNFDLELTSAEADSPLQLSCVGGSAGGRTGPEVWMPTGLRQNPAKGQAWVAKAELAEWTTRDLIPGLPQSDAYFAEAACFRVRSMDPLGRVVLEQSGHVADRYAIYAIPEDAGAEGAGARFVGLASPEGGVFVLDDPASATPGKPVPRYCGFRVGLDECSHLARPDGGGLVRRPRIRIELVEGARSYRIYRRIGDGEPSLVTTGVCDGRRERQIWVEDGIVPSTGGRVCYYVQVLDEHSNPSPNTLIGCLEVAAVLPVPLLREPVTVGEGSKVRLQWYCTDVGVDRFEVFLQPEYGEVQARPMGSVLTGRAEGDFHSVARHAVFLPGSTVATRVLSGEHWLTGRVGSDLGAGPEYEAEIDLDLGRPYLVWIKAVGSDGRRGNPSPARRVTWRRPQQGTGVVPWPARPTPVAQEFHPLVRAVVGPGCSGDSNGVPVGVRIGVMPWSDSFQCAGRVGGPVLLAVRESGAAIADLDPTGWILGEVKGSPPRPGARLLPIVLYREQVTNAVFPRVSGDLVQVSPMIERIAWGTTTLGNDRRAIWMLDPHVVMRPAPNFGQAGFGAALEMFLGDTHPVISGARYRYWLARFGSNGEAESIVPAGEVEIP